MSNLSDFTGGSSTPVAGVSFEGIPVIGNSAGGARLYVTPTLLHNKTAVGTAYTRGTTGFFTDGMHADKNTGQYITNANSIDTWQTIYDSGTGVSGSFSGIIPQVPATNGVIDVRVTIDGVAKTYTLTVNANRGCYIGATIDNSVAPNTADSVTTTETQEMLGGYRDVGHDYPDATNRYIPSTRSVVARGMPYMRFEDSILIETRCTVAATAGWQSYAGAFLALD